MDYRIFNTVKQLSLPRLQQILFLSGELIMPQAIAREGRVHDDEVGRLCFYDFLLGLDLLDARRPGHHLWETFTAQEFQ